MILPKDTLLGQSTNKELAMGQARRRLNLQKLGLQLDAAQQKCMGTAPVTTNNQELFLVSLFPLHSFFLM